jgi:hypothetical protein
MAAIDEETIGRANLDFASEHDIDEFVETLAKFGSVSCAAPMGSGRTACRCCA